MALDIASIQKRMAERDARMRVQASTPPPNTQAPRPDVSTVPKMGDVPERIRAVKVPKKDPNFKPPDLTSKYKMPNGTMALRELQNLVLHELENLPEVGRGPRGVAGLLGVGTGKTLLTILAGLATGAQRPLLVLPADMKDAFFQDYTRYGKHWQRPKNFRVMSYSELSITSGEEKLKGMRPDLLIFDEAHNLASPDSARTRKVVRYLEENPSCKVVVLSGTLTNKSLKDFCHLLGLVLNDWNPLPNNRRELDAWASIIDAKGIPIPGAWGEIAPLYQRQGLTSDQEQDMARKAFGEHLASTRCVVSLQSKEGCDASILFRHHRVDLPSEVAEAFEKFDRSWTRPDGEEIKLALDAYRVYRQLSQGFYYKWNWNAAPWKGQPDMDWLDRRARWGRACRAILKEHIPGYDSPLQVRRGLLNKDLEDPEGLEAWNAWAEVRHKPKPPTSPVWISDFMVQAAVTWAKKQKKDGIIWYQDKAMGDKLGEAGLPVFGAGQMPVLDGKVIACSMQAQGTGKNLQAYNKNFLLCFGSSGGKMEQLIGRTHRPGQEADEILVDFAAETSAGRDSVRSAIKGAKYLQSVTQNKQKLLLGTWDCEAFDRFGRLESGGDTFGEDGEEYTEEGVDEDLDGEQD